MESTSNCNMITVANIRDICGKFELLLEKQLEQNIIEICNKYNIVVANRRPEVDDIVRSMFKINSFWDPLIDSLSSANNYKYQIRDFLTQQVAQWLLNTKDLSISTEKFLDNLICYFRTYYPADKKDEKFFNKM
ncbi:unnamed protein product, partial [Rotaria sp. Silwood2]